jgi:hypothetical protein
MSQHKSAIRGNPDELEETIKNIFIKYEGFYDLNGQLIDWPQEAIDALTKLIQDHELASRIEELEKLYDLTLMYNGYDNQMGKEIADRIAQLRKGKPISPVISDEEVAKFRNDIDGQGDDSALYDD